MYSGPVAGAVFSRITIPHTFIMIGPNHTGVGSTVSLMSTGSWQIPTGSLEINEGLAARLVADDRLRGLLSEDSLAHQMEHSLEVQLPFICRAAPETRIVPLAMMSVPIETCRAVGEALAEAVQEAGHSVTVLASSDMSHYVSDERARKQDRKAIERILALDPEGLYRTVMDEHITMCGVIPVTTMLFAARRCGAGEAVLVRYMTSGEVSGDLDYVVGYAGVIVR
jgi:AmmeMemoRadiSam system protein B